MAYFITCTALCSNSTGSLEPEIRHRLSVDQKLRVTLVQPAHGLALAHTFFGASEAHTRQAMQNVADGGEDFRQNVSAQRVIGAGVAAGMQIAGLSQTGVACPMLL